MRDPQRLDKFYKELRDIHKAEFPDWRFGQFICNFLGWYGQKYGDPFYIEDGVMANRLKEYVNYVYSGEER
jgi:hypothetical protein